MIWYKKYAIDEMKPFISNTLMTHLSIEITDIGDDYVVGTMPVTAQVVQPARLLHGGASVVLAESLGSIASYMCIDPEKNQAVGLSINANHVSSIREGDGEVTGICELIHKGRSTHIWNINIFSPDDRLVCISRLTVAIIERRDKIQ